MRRIGFFILSLVAISSFFISCLDSDVTYSNNPHVATFSIQSDTLVPGIENTVFTVDTLSKKIYNADSVTYGAKVTKLVPTITFCKGASKILVNGVEWNSTDSLDFSSPLTMTFVATDGKTSVDYEVRINKHTVNPDQIIWTKKSSSISSLTGIKSQKAIWFNSKAYFFAQDNSNTVIFTSQDGSSWANIGSTSVSIDVNSIIQHNSKLFAVTTSNVLISSIDGIEWVNGTTESNIKFMNTLCSLSGRLWIAGEDENNELYLYSSTDGTTWTKSNALASNFPYLNQAKTTLTTKTNIAKAYLLGGTSQNSEYSEGVFSSMNGSYWINTLSDVNGFSFGLRKNAAGFSLDKKIFFFGGLNATNEIVNDFYVSIDEGCTWKAAADYQKLPDTFGARKNASAFVDDNKNIWIIGGESQSESLFDVWQGRLRKLDFLIQE